MLRVPGCSIAQALRGVAETGKNSAVEGVRWFAKRRPPPGGKGGRGGSPLGGKSGATAGKSAAGSPPAGKSAAGNAPASFGGAPPSAGNPPASFGGGATRGISKARPHKGVAGVPGAPAAPPAGAAGRLAGSVPPQKPRAGRMVTLAEPSPPPTPEELLAMERKNYLTGAAAVSYYVAVTRRDPLDDHAVGAEVANWSGTHMARPRRLFEPETERGLVALLARAHATGTRLRPVGSALSPNGLGLSDAGMVSTARLDAVHAIDAERRTVTAGAGARVSDVSAALARHGLALETYASVREQTLAGYTQAGCHGTGARVGTADDAVVGLELVTPAEGVLRLSADGPDGGAGADGDLFRLARLSLGTLGVVSRLTLRAVPLERRVLETQTVESRREVRRRHAERVAAHAYLRYLWIPGHDAVVVFAADPLVDEDHQAPAATAAAEARGKAGGETESQGEGESKVGSQGEGESEGESRGEVDGGAAPQRSALALDDPRVTWPLRRLAASPPRGADPGALEELLHLIGGDVGRGGDPLATEASLGVAAWVWAPAPAAIRRAVSGSLNAAAAVLGAAVAWPLGWARGAAGASAGAAAEDHVLGGARAGAAAAPAEAEDHLEGSPRADGGAGSGDATRPAEDAPGASRAVPDPAGVAADADASAPVLDAPTSPPPVSLADLRGALLALAPLDAGWVSRVNGAEAAAWRRASGSRVASAPEILSFDCGGEQWVLELALPAGTADEPSLADLDAAEEVMELARRRGVPAPAPVEQRWSRASASPLSPAHGGPADLFSWIGIIMYAPPAATADDGEDASAAVAGGVPSDPADAAASAPVPAPLPLSSIAEARREAVRRSFDDYAALVSEALETRYGAAAHWAKLEVPEGEAARAALRARLERRYPLEDLRAARRRLDPANILGSPALDAVLL